MKTLCALVLVGLVLDPGCTCSGNGHLDPEPFMAIAGDDVVNCNCNISLKYKYCDNETCLAHFEVPLCLPASLRLPRGADLSFNAPPDAGPGADPYSQKVDAYCRDVVTKTVYHLITVFNGNFCDYKHDFAPDGGIGDSVQCFAEHLSDSQLAATGRDDGKCDIDCPSVECDFYSNCTTDVEDSDGTIHLDRCKCSVISTQDCPGDNPKDLPRPLFCRPTDGVSITSTSRQ